MKAQISLTVPEGKRLIAEAIAGMSEVQSALLNGRILLKGGTTVSAVMERLAGKTLRISGRISPRGTKAAVQKDGEPHSVLIEQGKIKNIDLCFADAVQTLTCTDIAVIGANAIDPNGRTAMMFGSPLGGSPGLGMAGLMAQGCKVVIACGLEKMIPTPIEHAVRAAGIYSTDWAMGMAVGLTPLIGEVVTEKVAIEMLAKVTCIVIAAGGIAGAEGALTMVVEGDAAEVEKTVRIVLAVKGASTSGNATSLTECTSGTAGCAIHRACAWRKQKGGKLQW